MLELSSPYIYLLLCALFAASLTWLLYFFGKSMYKPRVRNLLVVFRFLILFFISALLLKPVLKYVSKIYEKPLIIVGVDNSSSMLMHGDSLEYKEQLAAQLEQLQTEVGDDFDWKWYTIGEKVDDLETLDFKEKTTDLAGYMNYVRDYYDKDYLAGVYLLTDGLYNRGSNPIYSNWDLPVGLNVVGCGDSTRVSDVKITDLENNSLAFVKNKFPIKVRWSAEGFSGSQTQLVLRGFGKELYTEEIKFGSDSETGETTLLVDAEKVGMQRFTLELEPLDRETNQVNNRRVFYMDIQDKRQKILLVYEYPSPDIAAIRSSLEQEEGYEIDLIEAKDFIPKAVEEIDQQYNAVVSFQIPTTNPVGIEAFNIIKQLKTSIWHIGSAKTNYLSWFNANPSLTWRGEMARSNLVQGDLNENFSRFNVEGNGELLTNLPPVKVPFGVLSYSGQSEVLFAQRIGNISTKYPLWLFTEDVENRRRAYFFGEGLWRWKIAEYAQMDNQDMTQMLISKTVQYLATQKDLSRFRVKSENRFYENENVEITSEFYNATYEPLNDPNVMVTITNKESGEAYELQMDRRGRSYTLNAGTLSPGNYSYKAKVNHQGTEYSKSGVFSVDQMDLEYRNTRADFDMLKNLASSTGGEFYYRSEWRSLVDQMKSIEPVKRSYESIEVKDLINQKWIFFLFLLWAGAEWVIRKREGAV